MPRRGKGQKIQTTKGQQYGAAKKQAAAQKIVSLPKTAVPAGGPPPTAAPRPGQSPFNRPTGRPGEHVTTGGVLPTQAPEGDMERRWRALMMLPVLEDMASQRGASPLLRNSVRKLKTFIGDPTDFADRNP